MKAEAKALPILSILHGLCKHYGMKYCYPSQLKILVLLATRQNLKISLSTLNRWLNASEKIGYLRRVRRIRRDKKRGMVFQSTVYKITLGGYLALSRFGVMVFDQLKELLARARGRRKKGPFQDDKVRASREVFSVKRYRNPHPNLKLPIGAPTT